MHAAATSEMNLENLVSWVFLIDFRCDLPIVGPLGAHAKCHFGEDLERL